jgi:Bacteriophage HK97-gp10, putative tail-component
MPVTIRIVGLDASLTRLRTMKASWANAPRAIVHQAAEVLKRALQEEAPERTGALRRGIRYRTQAIGPSVAARFTSEAAYTPFVIEGTRAHDIWAGFYGPAGGKRALFWPGAAHPTPYVRHPGTRADDFPSRAMMRVGPEVRRILEQAGAALVSDDPAAAVFWSSE